MNGPPVPIKPGDWAALLALLTWTAVKLDPLGIQLGRFVDRNGAVQHVAAVRDASTGATVWMISSASPSNGVADALMNQATATALKNGTTNGDGTVTYNGTMYKVALYWDGVNVTARTVV